MIDIHSHILPGIDDGSRNIDMTINMLKQAEEDGTKHIVATPHFCPGYGEATYSEVKKLVSDINKLVENKNMNIKVYHGQEVYYSQNIVENYKEGIIGTINDSRYMLIELPMRSKLDYSVFNDIYELKLLGIIPVLAHPERYKFINNSPWIINKFVEEGVLFQLNAGSVQGLFGDRVKKTANLFLNKGIYNFLASDCHNDNIRCSKIAEAMQIASTRNNIYPSLFKESAERLLNNKDIDFIGGRIKEKKWIFSLFR